MYHFLIFFTKTFIITLNYYRDILVYSYLPIHRCLHRIILINYCIFPSWCWNPTFIEFIGHSDNHFYPILLLDYCIDIVKGNIKVLLTDCDLNISSAHQKFWVGVQVQEKSIAPELFISTFLKICLANPRALVSSTLRYLASPFWSYYRLITPSLFRSSILNDFAIST